MQIHLDWEEFFTDPRMFLLPLIPAFVTLMRWAVGKMGPGSWKAAARVEAVVLAAVFGTVYGPRWPARFLNAAGADITVSWDAVIGLVIVGAALILMIAAFKRFSDAEGWKWIAGITAAYTIGITFHVVVTGGEPFATWFGVSG